MIQQFTEIDGKIINDGEFQMRAIRWSMDAKNVFKANIKGKMSSKQSGILSASVQSGMLKRGGMVERVSFDFHRYGIFMAYGVGKGYVHTPLGVIRGMRSNAYTKTKGRKDKGLFTPMGNGSINRKPVDWFDSDIPAAVESFANLIAEYYGDKYLINNDTVTRLSIHK